MTKATLAATAIFVIVAAIIAWPHFIAVNSQTAATAMAVEVAPMISPFDIMLRHGKNPPVEDWRDPF